MSVRRSELFAGLIAATCFLNVLPNDFTHDDFPMIVQNPNVTESGTQPWIAVWTTDLWAHQASGNPQRDLLYRPLAITSYRAIWRFISHAPLPQRLLNLILHVAICIMIVRLGCYLGLTERQAAAAGILFAVLPIHTEVLGSVIGRSDLLATFGVLAAILAHYRSLQSGWLHSSNRTQVVGWCGLACLAAFVGLTSKESAVGIVALLPIFDAYWRRQSDARVVRHRSIWMTLSACVYILLPLAAYGYLRQHALGETFYQSEPDSKTINLLVNAPSWQRVIGAFQLWGMYWAKTVWPETLVCSYSHNAIHLATSLMDLHVLIGLGIAMAIGFASYFSYRRGDLTMTALSLAIVIAYAPTSNAVVLLRVFFAERIWYLPSVFVVLLAAALLARGVYRLRSRALNVLACVLLVGVWVIPMVARCWGRSAEWRSNGTLYASAYRDHPDSIAVLNLYGSWLVDHSQTEKGIELLTQAVQIDPGYTFAHRKLGQAYQESEQYPQALEHLRIAHMQVPNHPPTEEALKQVQQKVLAGQVGSELEQLEQYLRQNPTDLDAEIELIQKLRLLGNLEQAWARLQDGDQRFAEEPRWHVEAAVTLVYADRIDDAITHYDQCIRLDPRNYQAMTESAMLRLERRQEHDLPQAKQLISRAAKLAPNDPMVLVGLAQESTIRGDIPGAIDYYKQAIDRLPPGDPRRRVVGHQVKKLGGENSQN